MAMIDMPMEELQHYMGTNPRPGDFDEYWSAALSELNMIDPKPELKPASFSANGAECFELTFTSVLGARIYAKYLRPVGNGRHPCLLFFHGYTANSGDWSAKLPYVLQGMCVVAMDVRGQGGFSQDPGGTHGNTCRGHIIRGLWDQPKDLFFRQIFLDTVQLYRVIVSFAEVDASRVGTMGESQGAALSIACSALVGKIKRSVIEFPFLSDFKRTWSMGMGDNAYSEIYEYFRNFDPRHEREREFFERLGYIDVHFLASRIKNPALMAIGLADRTCPASTQFAVYNNLGGPKELKLYPDFGHEYLPGFADIVFDYLKQL